MRVREIRNTIVAIRAADYESDDPVFLYTLDSCTTTSTETETVTETIRETGANTQEETIVIDRPETGYVSRVQQIVHSKYGIVRDYSSNYAASMAYTHTTESFFESAELEENETLWRNITRNGQTVSYPFKPVISQDTNAKEAVTYWQEGDIYTQEIIVWGDLRVGWTDLVVNVAHRLTYSYTTQTESSYRGRWTRGAHVPPTSSSFTITRTGSGGTPNFYVS